MTSATMPLPTTEIADTTLEFPSTFVGTGDTTGTSEGPASTNGLRLAQSMPAPTPAAMRLRTLYNSPGPYTSVILSTQPYPGPDKDGLAARWSRHRGDLVLQGAPRLALEAIDACLALPSPEDHPAIAVLAAADGTTLVDFGLEPPHHDVAIVDTLPYSAPILEWEQRRIPHLVVTVGQTGFDIATFYGDGRDQLTSYSYQVTEAMNPVIDAALQAGAKVVVLSGEVSATQPLADRLATDLGTSCRIVTLDGDQNSDELADEVVRLVSDASARQTVQQLREHRFLMAHDEAVDGIEATVEALVNSRAGQLLIHDDPTDQRRMWVGQDPTDLSLDGPWNRRQARLIDALIWSAVSQHVPVRITPTTGTTGPDDNTAASVPRELELTS